MTISPEMTMIAEKGRQDDYVEANREVELSRGQTPTIDPDIYEPKDLRDAGYPLSNPTTQPNAYTKKGAKTLAGRDAHDGEVKTPTTALPDPLTRLPQTVTFMTRSDAIFSRLDAAKSDVDTEMGLTNIYKQFMDYSTSLEDDYEGLGREQGIRLKWNTIDRLRQTGFDHLNRSEFTEEGIDDTGMNGLQMVFAAGVLQGKGYEDILRDVGDEGANDAQLEEAYTRAMQARNRAEKNVISGLPKTNEEAMGDPRYAGAVRTLMEAGGTSAEELNNMSTEDILSKGKWMSDMLKSNLLAIPAAMYDIENNPDSPIAEALTFLLETDENLPFEMADVGRFTMGMIGDPTTYLGGYGIWSKFAGKQGAGAILGKLGVGATYAGAMGAGYGALYDLGMQNIEMASAFNKEEFDPARLGTMTAMGATFGYVLGGAIGLAPRAKGLIKDIYQSMKTKEPSAAQEFSADIIPEAEMRVRRQLREFMEEDKLRKMADDEAMQKEFVELANKAADLEEKRLTLVKGGKAADAPDDPTHMAPMELVRNEQLIADQADADVLLAKIEKHSLDTDEGLKKYREEFYTEVQRKMLEKNDEVQKHIDAGDYRFKIDQTVTSKHSGKEFKIHHLQWKDGEPRYFVEGPEGEKHYMAEWGMVGGKPKLELVNGVPLEDFPE